MASSPKHRLEEGRQTLHRPENVLRRRARRALQGRDNEPEKKPTRKRRDAEKKEAVPANSEGAPPAADKPATTEPAKPAAPNVEEEASKANAQLTGWVYEIPAYKYDAIFKPSTS